MTGCPPAGQHLGNRWAACPRSCACDPAAHSPTARTCQLDGGLLELGAAFLDIARSPRNHAPRAARLPARASQERGARRRGRACLRAVRRRQLALQRLDRRTRVIKLQPEAMAALRDLRSPHQGRRAKQASLAVAGVGAARRSCPLHWQLPRTKGELSSGHAWWRTATAWQLNLFRAAQAHMPPPPPAAPPPAHAPRAPQARAVRPPAGAAARRPSGLRPPQGPSAPRPRAA